VAFGTGASVKRGSREDLGHRSGQKGGVAGEELATRSNNHEKAEGKAEGAENHLLRSKIACCDHALASTAN